MTQSQSETAGVLYLQIRYRTCTQHAFRQDRPRRTYVRYL